MRTALPLVLLLASCAAGPRAAVDGLLEIKPVKRGETGGIQDWAFEITNRTDKVIKFVDIKAGYGGNLESIGSFEAMAHAIEEGKTTIDPGETLKLARKESKRSDDLEVVVVFFREGIDERREARARARLNE